MIYAVIIALIIGLLGIGYLYREQIKELWNTHKKKIIAIALGSSMATGGLLGVPGLEISIEDSIIDSLDDYTKLGFNLDKIEEPYIYTEHALCEGHLPLAFKFETLSKDYLSLSENAKQSFISLDEVLKQNMGDIDFEIKILVNESYTREELIYKVTNDTDEVWNKEKECWEKQWVERERIVGTQNVSDYKYVWKDLEKYDLDVKQGTLIVIDIIGHFKASLENKKVDIVPTLTLDSYSKRYDKYAWWNSAWTYKKAITFYHANASETFTDFPVCINITDTDLRDDAQSDADDIAFVDSTESNQLAHEIEYWDDGTGRLNCWINLTSYSSSVNTTIYMYYGNAGASNQQNPTGVWNSHYSAVWHLMNASYLDSTSNNVDLTNQNTPTLMNSNLGKGLNFEGNSRLYHTTFFDAAHDKHTVLMYGYVDASVNDEHFLVCKQQTTGAGGTYMQYVIRTNWFNSVLKLEGTQNDLDLGDPTMNVYFQHGSTWNTTDEYCRWYEDGAALKNTDMGDKDWVVGAATDFNIGSSDFHPVDASTMEGLMDEVQVLDYDVSANYINTTWKNWNENFDGGFYSVGSEELSTSSYSISGLCDQNITWMGNQGYTVWCNATGTCHETLEVYADCSSTEEITEIRIYVENMTDFAGNWFGASNITVYGSSDNVSFGVPTHNPGNGNGVYLDGGCNITFNTSTWNVGTMGADPFTIENETSDTLYFRFKLSIPGTEPSDRDYYSSADGSSWAAEFKVYFFGNTGV